MKHWIRRVIEGKVYDTDTAQHVMHVSSPNHGGSSTWENTDLYRTSKGRWFLAGEGGGSTRWRRQQGSNAYVDGEGIKPLTEAEAKTLLEQDADIYEIYFEAEDA